MPDNVHANGSKGAIYFTWVWCLALLKFGFIDSLDKWWPFLIYILLRFFEKLKDIVNAKKGMFSFQIEITVCPFLVNRKILPSWYSCVKHKLGRLDANKRLNKIFLFFLVHKLFFFCNPYISITMPQHDSINAQYDACQIHQLHRWTLCRPVPLP